MFRRKNEIFRNFKTPKNFWLNAAESRVNTRKATYSCIYPSISSYDLLLKCGQLDIIPDCEAHKDSQGKLCGGKEPPSEPDSTETVLIPQWWNY